MNKLLKHFFKEKSNTLLENILLCAAITLTSSFIYYDRYYNFMGVVKAAVTVLIYIVWVYCAVVSGKRRKFGFLIFAGAYWAVPCLYLGLYPLRDNVHHYIQPLAVIKKICSFLFNDPLMFAQEKLGYSHYYFIAALIIVTFSFYFMGRNIGSIRESRAESRAANREDEDEDDYIDVDF